ncbi:MAG: hypothetical protein NOU37_07280 [Candidatus Brocadiales bacterium]|nr:hypothetical protein [Candidatus Bathyanammoxibius amoris]
MIKKQVFTIAIAMMMVFLILGSDKTMAQKVEASAKTSEKATKANSAVLTAGGTAYVRVKQYFTLSGEPTVRDSLGGIGYVLKNLNPAGAVAIIAKPTENDATFSFGDAVTLIEKKDGLPTMWLVAKAQTKVWIPAYVLTANKAEIDFLKENNRIPETMSYIYDDEGRKVWGVFIGGFGNSFVVDSYGMVLMAYAEGTSPFAIKGNAVVFDESVMKKTWEKPPVFNSAKKAFKLTPSCLYYCVSEGDKSAFECIDLVELKISK